MAGDGAGRRAPAVVGRDADGRITNLGQQAAYVWQELPVPVIAAVHGAALGGGLQIALGADIRIVAPDAKLSVLEVRWGLIPDMTGTQMLPRLVGLDVAKELTFTGRMVGGEEAVRIGLATRVADDPARRRARAGRARSRRKSPQAVTGAKRAAQPGRHRAASPSGFTAEERTIGSLIGTPQPGRGRHGLLREARPRLQGLTSPRPWFRGRLPRHQ